MKENLQKAQSINLISSDYQRNDILNVHLISAGSFSNIEAVRYYRPDYFLDTINDESSIPMTIWEIKNNK